MTTKTELEVPSYAEINHLYANHPDAFDQTVKRFVSMQDGVTENRKELTNTANFLGQGKLVCLALKDFIQALRSNTNPISDFDRYFLSRFGGKVPGPGRTLALVFDTHCLAPKTAARYVPESVYDGHYCRVLQAAGKVIKIAEGIKGTTPETSDLNHQVFTDVANILKMGGHKNTLQDLRNIEARLVWEPTKTDDRQKKKVQYLSVQELASLGRTDAS